MPLIQMIGAEGLLEIFSSWPIVMTTCCQNGIFPVH